MNYRVDRIVPDTSRRRTKQEPIYVAVAWFIDIAPARQYVEWITEDWGPEPFKFRIVNIAGKIDAP